METHCIHRIGHALVPDTLPREFLRVPSLRRNCICSRSLSIGYSDLDHRPNTSTGAFSHLVHPDLFIILSGFFFPIENMPRWVQEVSRINPVRFFMAALRAMF